MYDLTDYSASELDELLDDQRAQMVAWARIALAAPTARGYKSAMAEHDNAENMCRAILDEFARRRTTGV
jgi:hypothetical protein